MGQVNWQRRRDILISIICIGIILWVTWQLVSQFVEAVFILLLAMAIAFLISPAVTFLEKRMVPRIVATVIVYVIVLAVLGGLSYLLVFSLISQVQAFSATVTKFFTDLPKTYSNTIDYLVKQGIPRENIDATTTQISVQVRGFTSQAVSNALGIVSFITNTFLNFLVLMVISFYLTLDGKRIRDGIISIVPQRSLPHALLFEDSLNRVVGNYIRGQLTLALIIGVATALVCVFTGLGNFAIIFGVLGFIFETIPMVGPGLASISPVLVSLLLPGPFPRTLIIIICFIVIQALESNVLGPRIVGHAVGLHPVASILALLVFAKLFGTTFGAFGGAVGALVATPLVAAGWVVLASIYRSARGETPDQILARKRAPWTFRRPSIPPALRVRQAGTGSPTSPLSLRLRPTARGNVRPAAPRPTEERNLFRTTAVLEDREEAAIREGDDDYVPAATDGNEKQE